MACKITSSAAAPDTLSFSSLDEEVAAAEALPLGWCCLRLRCHLVRDGTKGEPNRERRRE